MITLPPKVAVIGAGIAGLSVALACQKKGLPVQIFEKHSKLINIGGGITIYPHGARALRALGLGKNLATVGQALSYYNIYSENTLLLRDTLDGFKQEVGDTLYSFVRSELQEMMAQKLSSGILNLGKKVETIEESEDGINLHFESGETFRANIVIACDGIHSEIARSYIFQQPIVSSYAGYCFWGGVLSSEDRIHEMKDYTVRTYLDEGRLCWLLSLPQSRQWWYIAHRLDKKDFRTGKNKLEQLREINSNWNPVIDRILAAKQDANNFGLPVHKLPENVPWSKGRVIAIGDAAHAMGPTLGQGANTAIIDALCLVYQLTHQSDYRMAFAAYEKVRRPIVKELFELEKKSADTRITFDQKLIESRTARLKSNSATELLEPMKSIIQAHSEVFKYFLAY